MWMAIGIISVCLFVFFLQSKKAPPIMRTREEVADILEDFVSGKGGNWDWDDFISFRIADSELERIREHCANLDSEHPSDKGRYCSEKGLEVIRDYIKLLRNVPD
jgi:hypothetical protein